SSPVTDVLVTDVNGPAPAPEGAPPHGALLLPPGFHERLSAEMVRRVELLQRAEASPQARAVALEACARDVVTFVRDWCWTYDPRLVPLYLPAEIPFLLRPKQEEYLRWLEERE